MRWLVALCLLVPAPAMADTLMYSFTGTVLSSGRVDADGNPAPQFDTRLNLGDGWINLAGASFAVSGLIGDEVPGTGRFATIPTWDFGDLGSFTMDPGFNQGQTVFTQTTFGSFTSLALNLWYPGQIDFQGFSVRLPTVYTLGDTFSQETPVQTFTGNLSWLMTNLQGEQLYLGSANSDGTALRIDTVSVQPVPEPATWLLLALGGGVLWRRHRQEPG